VRLTVDIDRLRAGDVDILTRLLWAGVTVESDAWLTNTRIYVNLLTAICHSAMYTKRLTQS